MSGSFTPHLVAFFGDGEYNFALPMKWRFELERVVGVAMGAMSTEAAELAGLPRIFRRLLTGSYIAQDLEVIRYALIGGGTSPADAARLWTLYGQVDETLVNLAASICDAHLHLSKVTVEANKPEPGRKPSKDTRLDPAQFYATAKAIGISPTELDAMSFPQFIAAVEGHNDANAPPGKRKPRRKGALTVEEAERRAALEAGGPPPVTGKASPNGK